MHSTPYRLSAHGPEDPSVFCLIYDRQDQKIVFQDQFQLAVQGAVRTPGGKPGTTCAARREGP